MKTQRAGERFSQTDIFRFPSPAGEGGRRSDEVGVRGRGWAGELGATDGTEEVL
jgi:hypothetical protein